MVLFFLIKFTFAHRPLPLLAEWPEIVLLLRGDMLLNLLRIPPPYPLVAELSAMVESTTVKVPKVLLMPPPPLLPWRAPMPTMGWLSFVDDVDPRNDASPTEYMAPSEPTSQ